MSRHSCVLSRHSFFPLHLFMSRHRFDCRDTSLLPFAWINVATEQRNVLTFFFREFLDNVATKRSIVATKFCLPIFIMSQHSFLCFKIYHSIPLILCRDKVVKCRDKLYFQFELGLSLLRHSLTSYLEIMSQHSELKS